MKNVNRTLYTWLGIFFFVMVPMFLYASNHLRSRFPGEEFLVTEASGPAFVSYDIRHDLKGDGSGPKTFRKASDLIPLKAGSKISSGGRIITGKGVHVDLLRRDRFALRIEGQSDVTVLRSRTAHDCYGVKLKKGRIGCKAMKPAHRPGRAEFLSVCTPGVTSCVRGTVFSVGFAPETMRTEVGVLDGAVSTSLADSDGFSVNVSDGKKAIFQGENPFPVVGPLSASERKRLSEVGAAKVKSSTRDKWNQTMDLVVESPFYRKALGIIVNYEMRTFKRAIIYNARLLWNGTVPDTLTAIELEDGDYADPWDTGYYYEKLDSKNAVLISAGWDKILHTGDDVFMAIQL